MQHAYKVTTPKERPMLQTESSVSLIAGQVARRLPSKEPERKRSKLRRLIWVCRCPSRLSKLKVVERCRLECEFPVSVRSVLGLPVCVPQPSGDINPSVGVRRAGILAGDQASVQRTLSVVAAGYRRRTRGTYPGAARAPSAGAIRGWQPRRRCRSGVAADPVKEAPVGA